MHSSETTRPELSDEEMDSTLICLFENLPWILETERREHEAEVEK